MAVLSSKEKFQTNQPGDRPGASRHPSSACGEEGSANTRYLCIAPHIFCNRFTDTGTGVFSSCAKS